jgi:hypothetical protein
MMHLKVLHKEEEETGEIGGGSIFVVSIALQGWWMWLQSSWRQRSAANTALKRARDRLQSLKKQEEERKLRKDWVEGGGDRGADIHYHQADNDAI